MRGGRMLREGADWNALIEALYRPVPGDDAWADGVVETAAAVVATGGGVGMHVLAYDAACTTGELLLNRGADSLVRSADMLTPESISAAGPDGVRAFFRPPHIATTHSEIETMASGETKERVHANRQGFRQFVGAKDMLGIVVSPEPTVSVVLAAILEDESRLAAPQRRLLTQLGLHLASAYRLRRRPEAVHAVVKLGGPGEGRIEWRARRIEASRSCPQSLLEAWTALVDGRWSLVPRVQNGRRQYLLLENAAQVTPMRSLTPRELEVLSMAARGLSNKLIAYGLGVSHSTVSETLGRVTEKLGVSSRVDVLRVAALLARDSRSDATSGILTVAEREILQLLREGLSNREMARSRGRSVNTIANQVAALLRKTARPSRRALLTS